MLLQEKKESPIKGITGLGGGIAYYSVTDESGYEISRSLRFNGSDGTYLDFMPQAEGNRYQWTFSAWIKKSQNGIDTNRFFTGCGSVDNNDWTALMFDVDDHLAIGAYSAIWRVSKASYRDTNAWMHVVVRFNLNEVSFDDRIKAWVNGVEVEWTSNTGNPSTSGINTKGPHGIGAEISPNNLTPSSYFNGYMADVHHIDGQILSPTDFATTAADGTWQPKKFEGQYSQGIPVVRVGTPSYPSNFTSAGNVTSDETGLSYGSWTGNYTGGQTKIFKAQDNRKFDLELLLTGGNNDRYVWRSDDGNEWDYVGNMAGLIPATGQPYKLSGYRYYATSEGSASTTLTATGLADGVCSFNLNFKDNSSTAALGYDQSVSTPSKDPKLGMDVITYSGNGGNNVVTGLGFEPDLVWIKTTSEDSRSHSLYDPIRGLTRVLKSDDANPEVEMQGVTGFKNDGFYLGNHVNANNSGQNYVAWCWNGGNNIQPNNDGSHPTLLTSNPDYGFSVVTYVSDSGSNITIGHGLPSEPRLIFFKDRTASLNWNAYHYDGSVGVQFEGLNNTNSGSNNMTNFNNILPNSSVISLASGGYSVNPTGNHDMVAYCWCEVSGYNKFGSYTGNGTEQTISCGFRPRYVMVKCSNDDAMSDTTNTYTSWTIYDTKRAEPTEHLFANNTAREGFRGNASSTSDLYDMTIEATADGFTLKGPGSETNALNGEYIFIAYADRPGNNFTPHKFVANEGNKAESNKNFAAVTWQGNSSTQNITDLDFKPDLVWIKKYATNGGGSSDNHGLFDSVRGTTKCIESNTDAAESTKTGVTAFLSNGFTLGASSEFNANNDDFIAWCWKAGDVEVQNDNGTISSNTRVNQQYGFSIVNWTGSGAGNATVGHGLSKEPSLIFIKDTQQQRNWIAYHSSVGANSGMQLNQAVAAVEDSGYFSDQPATDDTFSLGVYANESSTYIAYCWQQIKGFSKFGKYRGIGSQFNIECGFKPAFVMIKRITDASDGNNTTGGWGMYTWNKSSQQLMANCQGGAGVRGDCGTGANNRDIQSDIVQTETGFTVGSSQWYETNDYGGDGVEYAYAAFAERPSGIDVDSGKDTPTNVETSATGNYGTLNLLDSNYGANLTNGCRQLNAIGSWMNGRGSFALTSGKWFWEVTRTGGSNSAQIGIANYAAIPSESYGSLPADAWTFNFSNGTEILIPAGGGGGYFSGGTMEIGDVAGIALDMDSKEVTFYKNGVAGVPITLATSKVSATATIDEIFPWVGVLGANVAFNGGQTSFTYDVPTGYDPLCSAKLPDSDVPNGRNYFDALTYLGNASTKNITGLKFEPDFVWVKAYSTDASHFLYDQLRPFSNGNAQELRSQSTVQGDYPSASNSGLTSFNSDGFSLGSDGGANGSGSDFVSWVWNAGGVTVTDTTGSKECLVRASTTAGFSIIQYEGTGQSETLGHRLGAAPEFMIFKNYSKNQSWFVWHHMYDVPTTQGLPLEVAADVQSYGVSSLDGTVPDSTTIHIGGGNDTNGNGDDMIAYVWKSVKGFSKFGRYKSRDPEDPFIHCGFRPRWIMIKCLNINDPSSSWALYDTVRSPGTYNLNERPLWANRERAQGYRGDGVNTASLNQIGIDIVSNGFSVRGGGKEINEQVGNSYIWAAFAENPFKTSRAS